MFRHSPFYILNMRPLHAVFLFLCQLWLTFSLPTAVLIYSPVWYETACALHQRCETLGEERSSERIDELVQYWRHQGQLESIDWTKKERFHLAEVRSLFDQALLISGIAALMFLVLFRRGLVKMASLVLMGLAGLCGLVLPYFSTLWRDWLHPLLFDNDAWRNTPFDMSYYLMPDSFFLAAVILVLITAFVSNAVVYLACRQSPKVVASGRSG